MPAGVPGLANNKPDCMPCEPLRNIIVQHPQWIARLEQRQESLERTAKRYEAIVS